MGIETALIATVIGTQLLSGYQQAKQNKENAKAANTEAQYNLQKMATQAETLKKNASILAAKQKVSFLNSGTSLEGNPYDVISNTFTDLESDLGDLKSDIAYTGASYSQKIKSYQAGVRSSLLSGIASAGMTGAIYGYNAGWFNSGNSVVNSASKIGSGLSTTSSGVAIGSGLKGGWGK
jgi:CII-binding regulator of phage lambda lysogenization HflD